MRVEGWAECSVAVLAREKRGGSRGGTGEQAEGRWRGFAGGRLLGCPGLWKASAGRIACCLVDGDKIYATRVFTFDN